MSTVEPKLKICHYDQMKNKKYHAVGTVEKSKIVERGIFDTSNTLSWLGTCKLIKVAGLN